MFRVSRFLTVFLLIGLFLGGLLAAVVFYDKAMERDAQLEEAWAAAAGGKPILQAFPPTRQNLAAFRLEELAGELGIHLFSPESPQQLEEDVAGRFQEIQISLNEHSRELGGSEDGLLPAPPVGLAAYLDESTPILDEIVEHLLEAQAPVWDSDLSLGYGAPLQNFLGLLLLQRLLVLKAAEGISKGEDVEPYPEAYLEASWRLNQTTLANPNLIAQLIGQAVLRLQMAVVRGQGSLQGEASELWRQRFAELDLRCGVFLALQMDAWVAHYGSRQKNPLPGVEIPAMARPFMGLGMRDFARRYQAILEQIPHQDLRTFDPGKFLEEAESEIPRWQIIARLLIPNLVEAWPRAARTELSAELTALVLEERERRVHSDVPPSAGRQPSCVEGLNWVYEVTEQGLAITLDGELAHPGPHPLSNRFVFREQKTPGSGPRDL